MWCPQRLNPQTRRFLAIVEALEADIAAGRAAPGERLFPQRELAYRLGVSVGTVVQAYAVATRRGLITAQVGRGTYIRDPRSEEGADFFGDGSNVGGNIDLSLNLPPISDQGDLLSETLTALAREAVLPELLRYGPHTGLLSHRRIIADWISLSFNARFVPAPERIVICHGAQHALWIILSHVTKPGDVVLTEELTYPGFKAAAAAAHVKLIGVEMDSDGVKPDALDAACERTQARTLFTMPTLQNPTGLTMSDARRDAIINIVRRRDLIVIEDDVYGFLCDPTPTPLAARIPDHVFFVGSVSKCLAPGLRVGFVVSPPQAVAGLEAAIRSTAWMATPIMVEVVARWLASGIATKIAKEKKRDATLRRSLAQRLLGRWLGAGDGAAFHVWLQLPASLPPAEFSARARARGIIVTPTDSVIVEPTTHARGVRLCLGAARDDAELRRALTVLADILNACCDDVAK